MGRLVFSFSASGAAAALALGAAAMVAALPFMGSPAGAAALADLDPFFSYQRSKVFSAVRSDVKVKVRDGEPIACQLYRPGAADNALADGPFPSIVYNYTGYAAAAGAFGEQASYYVERGYNAVVCQARGSTTATGVGDPFGPQEQRDNYDVIEWIAAQPWSTDRVGQAGVSYGAHSALLVAVNQPPSLKAIIAVNGIHDWYENTIYRGGIYSQRIRPWQAAVAPTTLKLYADNPLYNDFWQGHSVKSRWDRLTVPTLAINGWYDRYRDGMVKNYRARPENVWLVSGPWKHGATHDQFEGLDKGAYLAWWDRWLKNDLSAPLPNTHVTSYETPGPGIGAGWQQFEQWPPARASEETFALTRDLSLSTQPGPPGTGSFTVNTDPDEATAQERLLFRSAPLAQPRVFAGSGLALMHVSFSAPAGNLALVVYDEAPDGSQSRVTGGWLKAALRNSLEASEPVVPGRRYVMRVDLWPVHYRFGADHRVVLRAGSDDYPEIVSDALPGQVTIFLGEGGSSLSFPVIQ